MQTHDRMELKKVRAAEVLKSVLTQVSGIKLRNIEVEPPKSPQNIDIVAQIQIYGRNHTLACMLLPKEAPEHTRQTVAGFCSRATNVGDKATPIFIAPRVSPNLKKLCSETNAGLVDLAGNARIELGDVFIACHRQPQHRRAHPGKAAAHQGPAVVH